MFLGFLDGFLETRVRYLMSSRMFFPVLFCSLVLTFVDGLWFGNLVFSRLCVFVFVFPFKTRTLSKARCCFWVCFVFFFWCVCFLYKAPLALLWVFFGICLSLGGFL